MPYIKICLNCGDNLLEQAKKCPTCGKKDLTLVEKEDSVRIEQIKNGVPNPKGVKKPNWQANLDIVNRKEAQRKVVADRKQKAEADGVAYCPKCGSTSVTALKKGFGLGKAIAGVLTLGNEGVLAGALGMNKVEIHCMKCGHKFRA